MPGHLIMLGLLYGCHEWFSMALAFLTAVKLFGDGRSRKPRATGLPMLIAVDVKSGPAPLEKEVKSRNHALPPS